MYYEIGIIRENRVIDATDLYPNQDLDLYLRSHERAQGSDDWFEIANLTKKDIKTIEDLLQSDEEKEFLGSLKEDDILDILLHFGVIIKNG